MKSQDTLHVLPHTTPAKVGPVKVGPVKFNRQENTSKTPPDQLALAVAALRGALEAEVNRPRKAPTPRKIPKDHFTLIGRPTWRANCNTDPVASKVGRVGAAAGAVIGTDIQVDATTRDPLARRITAIHLPRFAIERWEHWAASQHNAPPETLPTALATEGPHGPVIYATNRPAEAEGVYVGARVVDMRALCPILHITFADVGGDVLALERLMLWTRRWCPWTAQDGTAEDGTGGLILDTTGSDHLWGGEAAMLRDMEEKLAFLGFSANLATSPTHGASWALARFGGTREACSPATLKPRMAPFPVRALRLDGDTVQLLDRLGLKTVGDLGAVPRISLARRFSRAALPQNPLLRLDQMMGHLSEPLSASEEPPHFAVQANLAEPVQDPTPHLPALCAELCAGLSAAGFGARRIRVTVFHTDGDVSHVDAATARPNRDAAHLLRLFDDKIERINPGFGFDLITLAATVAERLETTQTRLDGGADDGAALARLTDRLVARLGAKSVRAPKPRPSHIPERAEVWDTALHAPTALPLLRPHRPIRLFDHPEEIRVLYAVPEGPPAQFIWRRVTHRVVRFAGPERIAPEWWQDSPGTRLRDYYRIEDHTARRFWLYREGVLGDGRGDTPRWFVHGVFA